MNRRTGWVAALVLSLHAGLALHTAWVKSPVWDEIVYPAAGYDLWDTGRISLSSDHPPLGKALLAVPLRLLPGRLSIRPAPDRGTDSFRYGFRFVFENRLAPFWLTFLPRLVSLAFSLGLGLLIFGFTRRRWGDAPALLSLVVFCLSPAVIARASLALLEMPLVFFMTATWITFLSWLEQPVPRRMALWIALWTAALLVKATALLLGPAMGLAVLGIFSKEPTRAWRTEGLVLAGVGVALGISEGILRLFGSSFLGDQTLIRAQATFSLPGAVYFHGATLDRARWFWGVAAWGIKTPVSVMFLAGWGLAVWKRRAPQDPALLMSLSLGWVALALMLGVRSIISTTHYFFLYPVLAILAAPLVHFRANPWRRRGLWLLSLWLFAACAGTHPDHLAYMNEFVGGTRNGGLWLADSDQDWGQDLRTLSQWMKAKNIPAVLLGYSGPGDPRAYGIYYQDVLSPALVSAVYRGAVISEWPQGIYLVIGSKVLQSESYWLGWLLANRKPVERLGGTLWVYDLSHDEEALAWLGAFYRKTGRPVLANALPRRS